MPLPSERAQRDFKIAASKGGAQAGKSHYHISFLPEVRAEISLAANHAG
jgi:hypothetical protein